MLVNNTIKPGKDIFLLQCTDNSRMDITTMKTFIQNITGDFFDKQYFEWKGKNIPKSPKIAAEKISQFIDNAASGAKLTEQEFRSLIQHSGNEKHVQCTRK